MNSLPEPLGSFGRWLRFTAGGLLFAMSVELVYKLIVKWAPDALGFAAAFYVVFLQGAWLVRAGFKRRQPAPQRAVRGYLIVTALLALVVLEWGLVGFRPGKTPLFQQVAMLVLHAGWLFMAYLFAETGPAARRSRRAGLGTLAILATASMVAVVARLHPVIALALPIATNFALCVIAFRYSRGGFGSDAGDQSKRSKTENLMYRR